MVATPYHSITEQVAHVAFLEATRLARPVQVNAGFSNLLRVIPQVFPPFFHFFFNVLIYEKEDKNVKQAVRLFLMCKAEEKSMLVMLLKCHTFPKGFSNKLASTLALNKA